jgi:hypothetical protein
MALRKTQGTVRTDQSRRQEAQEDAAFKKAMRFAQGHVLACPPTLYA